MAEAAPIPVEQPVINTLLSCTMGSFIASSLCMIGQGQVNPCMWCRIIAADQVNRGI